MSQRRWDEAHNARTLIQAHDALVGLRPKPDAPIPEWIAFHQRSSAVYQTLAQVDEGHRLEALYWAAREKGKADELAGSTGRRKTQRVPDGDAVVPATLAQAHDALREVRPSLVAAPTLWRAYHEHAATVYAEVSEVDRGHHHEAAAWASRERIMAELLSGRTGTAQRPTREADREHGRCADAARTQPAPDRGRASATDEGLAELRAASVD